MTDGDAPYHAHIYYAAGERPAAAALREAFALKATGGEAPPVLFVGRMVDRGTGPHPLPQYEIHFRERALAEVVALIEASGLRALVHPLTDDDTADHTSLAHWIGAPLELDATVLDPPGHNQGIPRFGKTDFED
jgi:aromatic ring-cleaving dioxygenase